MKAISTNTLPLTGNVPGGNPRAPLRLPVNSHSKGVATHACAGKAANKKAKPNLKRLPSIFASGAKGRLHSGRRVKMGLVKSRFSGEG